MPFAQFRHFFKAPMSKAVWLVTNYVQWKWMHMGCNALYLICQLQNAGHVVWASFHSCPFIPRLATEQAAALEVNLALQQEAWMSGGTKPERGNDGDINPSWGGNGCTQTNTQEYPWWATDLGGSYDVRKVVVMTRDTLCEYSDKMEWDVLIVHYNKSRRAPYHPCDLVLLQADWPMAVQLLFESCTAIGQEAWGSTSKSL